MMRHSGVVRNVAVIFTIDIDWQGTLIVLGVSVAISEADIHWRSFLESLFERKLRSVHEASLLRLVTLT